MHVLVQTAAQRNGGLKTLSSSSVFGFYFAFWYFTSTCSSFGTLECIGDVTGLSTNRLLKAAVMQAATYSVTFFVHLNMW